MSEDAYETQDTEDRETQQLIEKLCDSLLERLAR